VIILVGIVVGLMLGLLLARLYRTKPNYRDPQLHDGPWELQGIENGEAVWRRRWLAYLGPVAPDHPQGHVAHECRIGRGLSHYDRCACGAVRYGIYGNWELPCGTGS
jgi:hypothetical protein